MSEASVPDCASLPVPLGRHLHRVCRQFEDAWKTVAGSGQRPRIEDYVGATPEPEGAVLVRELILLDVDYCRLAGEAPHPEDYQRRFPALDPAWLAHAVATPARATADPSATPEQPTPPPQAAEEPPTGTRPRPIHCPHCHHTLEVVGDQPEEVLCPGCGGSFHVHDTRFTTTTAEPRQLGKFLLLEQVGVGAFGTVWKARDTELERIVALKIPHASLVAAPAALERFYREARAAAQLRHPGIVTVHEVTTLEGVPVIVADFVAGVPLRDLLDVRRLTFRETATLVAGVAEALDYAHELGLVHRDIKPANIMVESEAAGADGHLRLGKPLVVDFGLALRQEAEISMTLEGQIIGTPAYMSPEQAAGRGHRADRRSDVYSLGVVLYELLTGELPFRGSKVMLVQQMLHEEPRPPRRINDQIPRDLETICLKALAKEPGRRYATARALADELRRWLNGEPIQARPVGAWERGWRWARRRPATAALVLVSGVAVLAVGGVGSGSFYYAQLQEAFQKAEQEKERAVKAQLAEAGARQQEEEQRKVAQSALEKANFHQYFHHIARAHAGLREGNLVGVEKLLDECPVDQRRWEWDYLKRQCHGDLLTLEGHTDQVWTVAFSPDGTRIASGSRDKTVKVWNATTGQETRTLTGHTDQVISIAFSPDGTRIASGSWDKTVKVWNATTGQETRTLGHELEVDSVAFSPDGTQIASGSRDSIVKVWDAATGQVIHTLLGHGRGVPRVAFSPDGTRLASASWDRTVKVWDVASGQELRTLKGHTSDLTSVAFSPDGMRLASAGYDSTVKVWDATTGQEALTLKGHTGSVEHVAFSPDGKRLASASVDGTVKVWDATTGQEAHTLKGHTREVKSVAFSPDGTRLASGSRDQTVKVWNATTSQEAHTLKGHTNRIISVAFSPDGTRLASAGGGMQGAKKSGEVKIWDARSGQEVFALEGHTNGAFAVGFSPDGSRLAAGSGDGTVKIWHATTGREALPPLKGHTDQVWGVAFSPDGTRLASASWDGTVKVWDATTGQETRTLKAHTKGMKGIQRVAFSPDGTRIASGHRDNTVQVWDATTGQNALFTLEGHTSPVYSVAFSPDGRWLASASWDGTVKIWDLATGQEALSLEGHTSMVLSVAFSPDGRQLASASQDQTVKVWDAATGQEALSLKGHTARVASVAFSPDGTRLASASYDETVKIWDGRPWTAAAAVEREALGLLDFLFTKPLCQADLVEYLKNSPTITPQARQMALELVEGYRAETDPERYHQASWAVVRQRYLNAFQYRFALRQAQTACRLAPEQGKYLTTLGVAQYRAGQYPQALVTLRDANQRNQGNPTDLAFLALTQHQLGQKEQALASLARLQEASKQPRGSKDDEALSFLREAEALIYAKAAESRK